MFKRKIPSNGWQLGASELPLGKQSTQPIINMRVVCFFFLFTLHGRETER